MKREDGRKPEQIRPVKIKRNYIPHAEGSALISVGNTVVICTASIEEQVPKFLEEANQGWVTAEYSMLPRATQKRTVREAKIGRPGGRTQEIQRLIGRSLRAVVDLGALPQLTIYVDADVVKADGGTRTAAITGCFVALYDAMRCLKAEEKIKDIPIKDFLAATSVGVIDNEVFVDLDYSEDSNAEVDMNIIMTETSGFVELQGTAEKEPFGKEKLDAMIDFASKGIHKLIEKQKKALEI